MRETYNLAIQKVLLHHDYVDSLGVLERQEAETTRSPRAAITHNCAFDNFAKLFKIVPHGFWHCQFMSTRPRQRHHSRSVVSQFRPPINIFLQDHQQIFPSCRNGMHQRVCGGMWFWVKRSEQGWGSVAVQFLMLHGVISVWQVEVIKKSVPGECQRGLSMFGQWFSAESKRLWPSEARVCGRSTLVETVVCFAHSDILSTNERITGQSRCHG